MMDPREGEWQYKRVRGMFGSRSAVESAIEEQAAWGWRLVEVIDVYHLRFGRPAVVALKDVGREGNPYATASRNAGRAPAVVAFILLCGIGLAGLFLMARARETARVAATATPVAERRVFVGSAAAPAHVVEDHGGHH